MKTGPAISTLHAKSEHHVSFATKKRGLSKIDGRNKRKRVKALIISLVFQTTFWKNVRLTALKSELCAPTIKFLLGAFNPRAKLISDSLPLFYTF